MIIDRIYFAKQNRHVRLIVSLTLYITVMKNLRRKLFLIKFMFNIVFNLIFKYSPVKGFGIFLITCASNRPCISSKLTTACAKDPGVCL